MKKYFISSCQEFKNDNYVTVTRVSDAIQDEEYQNEYPLSCGEYFSNEFPEIEDFEILIDFTK